MNRWLSAVLWAAGLTLLTYVADRAGGHPAKSAPIILFVVWLLIVIAARWAWGSLRRL